MELSYDFRKRVSDLEEACDKCVEEVIELGVDPNKVKFRIKQINENNSVVHIGFSSYIMEMLPLILEHGDILQIEKTLKKAREVPHSKFLILTKKELIARGEVGISLAKASIERACQRIKGEMRKKDKEKKERIIKTKEEIVNRAKEIISKLPAPELMKVFYKKGEYCLIITFYRKRRRGYKEVRKKLPSGMNLISGIKVKGKNSEEVISRLADIINSFILNKGAQ